MTRGTRTVVIDRPVVLIGFSGSGKSTAGKILANTLGVRFVDTDREIERRTGQRITDMFAEQGEHSFRKLEREVIEELVHEPMVVGLGGGAFMQASVRKHIQDQGISVYLRCSQKELYRRLQSVTDRPLLLQGDLRENIKALLDKRKATYEMADHTLSVTNLTPAKTAAAIVALLRTCYAAR